MANVVTTQIQNNGFRNAQVLLTNLCDGTAETDVVKVDATSTGPYGVKKAGVMSYPGIHLSVWKVYYTIQGMAVHLLWEATQDTTCLLLAAGTDELDFSSFGGLRCPAGVAGITGSIGLSTIAAAANSSYSITLFLKKNVPVS